MDEIRKPWPGEQDGAAMTTELVKYDAACRAIAEAAVIDDVVVIKDKSEALRAYARQIKNPKLEADAWAIRKRAEVKLGELSAGLDKAERARTDLHPIEGKQSKRAALKAAGISTSAANRYEQFSKLPQREQEQRIARGRDAILAGKSIADAIIAQGDKKERRDKREQALAVKQLAMPTGKFNVIVTDDEVDHGVYSRETGMDRHASNHYETAADAHTAAELHERTKDRFACAADDCVVFQWSTVQHLDVMIDLLRLRGFRYVSHYVWGKDKIGLGYWNRNKHEILLIGTRGDIPCPAPGDQWELLVMAPRGEHSAKPECFLEMIEQYFPNLPKIEFNRRGPARPGWAAWGNEAETSEAAE